mmetsp:Transcript_16690/g.39286  ORF Transcript_16690/g.39286 Transcript_16690/m.39286 type:complete len:286 (+) Transcript_16690:450-1307(+)
MILDELMEFPVLSTRGAVGALILLTVALEHGVDNRFVHSHEGCRNGESEQEDQQHADGVGVGDIGEPAVRRVDNEEGANHRGCHSNERLAQQQEDRGHHSDGRKAQGVSQQEGEGGHCTTAEVHAVHGCLDIGLTRSELEEPLQASKTALGAAPDRFDNARVLFQLLHLGSVVSNHHPNELDQGNEEGAEGCSAHMVPHCFTKSSDNSALVSPVPLGDCVCHSEIGNREIERLGPEQHEQVKRCRLLQTLVELVAVSVLVELAGREQEQQHHNPPNKQYHDEDPG